MKSFVYFGLCAALLLAVGCSDENDDLVPKDGAEGGKCYPNGTCNAGLTCYSNLCVKVSPDGGPKPDMPGANKDTGPGKPDLPATQKDGPAVKPDTKAWPCTKNSQCDDKLSCTDDVCTSSGCKNTLKANQCLISRTCYAFSAVNPTNACLKCIPNTSTAAWTLVAASGCVTTYAGTGSYGYKDGQHDAAQFNNPTGMAQDSSGALYIADRRNHRVRKLAGGKVTTVAGTGTQGYKDGVAAVAQFNEPYDLWVDSLGAIYVVERAGHRVRMIKGGTVSTIAGTGVAGYANGAAAVSKISFATGIVGDNKGNIFIADKSNHRIRRIRSGQVTTYAGQGSGAYFDGPIATAKFKAPEDVAVDASGNMYVADTGNHRIRLISAGKVSTLSGDGVAGLLNGTVSGSRFNKPSSVAVSSAGIVYVADTGNHVIRKIAAGVVTTLAGTASTYGFADGPVKSAKFNDPIGLTVDSYGKVFVADRDNHRIRLITP